MIDSEVLPKFSMVIFLGQTTRLSIYAYVHSNVQSPE